jgi:putative carbamoyl-phosphate synthase L chain, ATP-binding
MKNKKYTILVTGVGAIIGYGIIKSLRVSGYDCNIIGIDIFYDAVGQKWCDEFVQGKRADSKDFINFINNIVKKRSINLVIPGIEQDLESLIKNFEKLNKNAKYVLNNKELFDVFYNKKKTYDFLSNKIDLIPYIYFCDNLYEKAKDKFGLPFILKQDVSYASKGVATICNQKDFMYFVKKFGQNCMAQKKLDIRNSEYTCSIFGLGDGNFVNPICLQRELSTEGATKKAINIQIDKALMEIIQIISKHCKFEGPTNLQFIKYINRYLLLEINARFSSSTSIREIFGVNEAKMCIEYYLENKTPELQEQKFGTVVRYIEDAYFDSNSF